MGKRMKLNYSITLENDIKPCQTTKGTINATSPGAAASRVVKLARKEFKGYRWRSLVVVLEKEIDE